MFSAETLNEAARPVSMALNVAKCDSSRYNFAGGRLDIITSWKAVEVNQSNNAWRVVNPLFRAWYVEARLIYGWKKYDGGEIPAHHFLWVGMPYSDPEAEQNADEAAIKTGLKGIQEIYSRRGKDWKVCKKANARALDMTPEEYMKFILANLETNKGGDQGPEGEKATDTPEQVKAKFKTMFPKLAERMNGHLSEVLP
jgi:capsid protein